jgi:hypothetical protein
LSSLSKDDEDDDEHPPEHAAKKKKMRYSRELKRERKAEQLENNGDSTTAHNFHQPGNEQEQEQQRKRNNQQLSFEDRIHSSARNSQFTMSTAFEHSRSPSSSMIRVVTSSSLYESRKHFPPAPDLFATTIRVQPLLILDLNGILCHRSRKHREPLGVQLRELIGNVAGTPVVPRMDLLDLLRLLDQYFCLAIWTSAKRHTARVLLDMLVPAPIQQRFLFVWTQSECHHAVVGGGEAQQQQQPNTNTDYHHNDVVFEKHLPKIWKAFPLWNADNTLLVDDSPDKCPYAVANAIHPPPIHGQWRPPSSFDEQQEQLWRPDSQNERYQYDFFQQFIDHWHLHSHERRILVNNNSNNNDTSSQEHEEEEQHIMSNRTLYEHLMRYGSGHMGWRGGDGKPSSWQDSFSKAGPTLRARDLWNGRDVNPKS